MNYSIPGYMTDTFENSIIRKRFRNNAINSIINSKATENLIHDCMEIIIDRLADIGITHNCQGTLSTNFCTNSPKITFTLTGKNSTYDYILQQNDAEVLYGGNKIGVSLNESKSWVSVNIRLIADIPIDVQFLLKEIGLIETTYEKTTTLKCTAF